MQPTFVLLPVTIATAVVAGLVTTLVESILHPLSQRLGSSDKGMALLETAFFLALIPGVLIYGIFLDRMGIETAVIGSALLAAVGIALLALREAYPTTLATILLIGLAAGGLITSSTLLMTAVVYPGKPGAAVALGSILVGLAGAVTPALTTRLMDRLRLRRALLLLALVSLVPALAAALTPADSFPTLNNAEGAPSLADPVLWLCGAVLFLYAPIEAALTMWVLTHLNDLGFRERTARLVLVGFWIAFCGARLLTALLLGNGSLHDRSFPWLILGLSLCIGVALGNLVGTARRGGATWGVLTLGFFCGPVYPLLAGIVLLRFEREPGTAFGMMYALGAVGSLFLLPVIGIWARRAGVQRALRIPLVAALVSAGVALVLGLTM